MFGRHHARLSLIPLLFAMSACATGTGGGRRSEPPPSEPATAGTPGTVSLETPPELAIEVVVTGRSGRPVGLMRASDFRVTVDGRRRLGLSISRLYRGPGAEYSAAQHPAGLPGEVQPLYEPKRTVLLVIDQSSLLHGEETMAREAAEACLNLLGISDQVAVVALPTPAQATNISFERGAAHETLARLRAVPPGDALAAPLTSLAEDNRARSAAAGPPDADRAEAGREETGRAGAAQPPDDPARSESNRPTSSFPREGASEAARAATRAHAVSTLAALEAVCRSLQPVLGGKTILFLSGGLVASEAEGELRAVVEASARAHTRIVSLRLPTDSSLRNVGSPDLQRLAEQTGGALVSLPRRPQQVLANVAEQLSLSYLLLLAPVSGDRDSRAAHTVRVEIPGRRDVFIQAPSLVAPGLLQREQVLAVLSPAARATTARSVALRPPPPKATAEAGKVPSFRHDPAVDAVLARVTQYVNDYGPVLSSIVSEERYVQDVQKALDGASTQETVLEQRRRVLASDFLTVRVDGIDGWLPFRDVFEVNGRAVRDRQDRLSRLFIDKPSAEQLRERGNAIIAESARYNVGSIRRTLNVPTLPLWFLEPGGVERFAFRKSDEVPLDGRKLWVLQFTEVATPTFVKTPEGGFLLAWGSVWVDPLNGTVHKTELHVSMATVTVTYGQWPGLPGVYLPLKMEERYPRKGEVITGEATYSKFRQFKVTTEQQIHLPKK